MSQYERMRPEDRERAIAAGLIEQGSKLSDYVPSKDRRYSLIWKYCGVEEPICENKTWIYCKSMLDKKKHLQQYVNEKFFHIDRVK